ncbi:MAG: methionine--tRNA ligase [Candidatus Nanoarchaeia archaeon]|nr:methionine--tRNA ligase [Candidatus Nanoarchaeia archaeon]
MEKRLITSALPYVNNVPHLGNLIGCVLSADVFARFSRLMGHDVLYVCGTDEHGTATEAKAIEENLTPKQICDKYHKIHDQIYKWMQISFDAFGRTSDKEHHEITTEIFKRIYDNGFIIKKTEEKVYCPTCQKFLADRFVYGTCPHCGYQDARGDQCDNCGKLLNPEELKEPKCKTCQTTPIMKETEHLYITLDKMQKDIQDFFDKNKENGWTYNSIKITENWLKGNELKPRAITRDLKWGIKVPNEYINGEKVFYVWFDAPIGYISITKKHVKNWENWWKNPETKLYQFMGKDNVSFHSIIFPATLMAYNKGLKENEQFVKIHRLCATEYLNYEGGKFSKSRNLGVFGDDIMNLDLSQDLWRYYLISARPESADTNFSWDEFQEKVNNELVANIGNYINRVLTFLNKNYEGQVIDYKDDEKIISIKKELQKEFDIVIESYDKTNYRDAIKHILHFSKILNQFFQEVEPWVLIKEDRQKTQEILSFMVNTINYISTMINPIVPESSKKICDILDIKISNFNELNFNSIKNQKIKNPTIIFNKIEDDKLKFFKEKFSPENIHGKLQEDKNNSVNKMQTKEEFSIENCQIRVGEVISVEDHPNADKLYVFNIDFGDEKRQILAGLKSYFTKDELLGKKLLYITNLKYAKIRGMESQGMTIAAEDDSEKVSVLEFDAPKGTYLSFEKNGKIVECKNSEIIDAEKFFNLNLKIENGVIKCQNLDLKVLGKDPITSVKNGLLR